MHISFFLDLKILLKTVAVVFSRKDYQEGCVENADAVTANKPKGFSLRRGSAVGGGEV